MLDESQPNLGFPDGTFGPQETPWDLRRWLYVGGARTHLKSVAKMIDTGVLGTPLTERLELVTLLHENLINYSECGGRIPTIASTIEAINSFFKWVDENNYYLSLDTVDIGYRDWTDMLLHRIQYKKDIKEKTAYTYASRVGRILDKVLERSRPLISTIRLAKEKNSRNSLSPKNEKQNLADIFSFGHFLRDLTYGLGVDNIWGDLPVEIPLETGKTIKLWSCLKPLETIKPPNPKYPNQSRYLSKKAERNRKAWQKETTFRTRYPIINLRILAEMLMLMGQPGVNMAQVHKLRMDEWRYKPITGGYEIRTYKHRRGGEVVFQIYTAYRPQFDRYIQWRKSIFPEDPDGLLFPLLGKSGLQPRRHKDKAPQFTTIRTLCKEVGIKFISPIKLRSANVNWMLRETQNPELTSQEKQHSERTLLEIYDKPSLQRAMVQVHVYWAKYDPAETAAGPGACTRKIPELISEAPNLAPKPDCETPAGCLFCNHQRDVDNFHYVWSLVSYRLLKSFELRSLKETKSPNKPDIHPAEAVINHITEKLRLIKASSKDREEWVNEALLRAEEGWHHPAWSGLIDSI